MAWLGREKYFISEFRKQVKQDTSKIKSINDETNLYKAVRKGILNNNKKFEKMFPELDFLLTRSLFKVYNSKSENELFAEFETHYRKLKNKEKEKVKKLIEKTEKSRYPLVIFNLSISSGYIGGASVVVLLKAESKKVFTAILPYSAINLVIYGTLLSIFVLNKAYRKKLAKKLTQIIERVDNK